MPLSYAIRLTARRRQIPLAACLLVLAAPALAQQAVIPEASPPARAILYEEDINHPTGRREAGLVEWRVLPTRGKNGVTVLGEIRIPGRPIGLSFLLYRNNDPAVAANHVIDLIFRPPFDSGGIQSSPGILMKPSEQERGRPLIATSVKLATNQFSIRLSNAPDDVSRNLALWLEHGWIDIPFYFEKGRQRAIIAVEKGRAGTKALDDMLSSQSPPPDLSPQSPAPGRPAPASPESF